MSSFHSDLASEFQHECAGAHSKSCTCPCAVWFKCRCGWYNWLLWAITIPWSNIERIASYVGTMTDISASPPDVRQRKIPGPSPGPSVTAMAFPGAFDASDSEEEPQYGVENPCFSAPPKAVSAQNAYLSMLQLFFLAFFASLGWIVAGAMLWNSYIYKHDRCLDCIFSR